MTRLEIIHRNIDSVLLRMARAAEKAGRRPEDVELVAVTKYASAEDTAIIAASGKVRMIGESRVIEAETKWALPKLASMAPGMTKRFIGHLQSNKAAKAAAFFDTIDSIDSFKTAAAVSRKAAELGKTIPVLIQLKLTDRETQSGLEADEARKLLDEITGLGNIVPSGYLGIAPVASEGTDLRPVFAHARKLFEKDFGSFAAAGRKCHLSLGMSGDFETAIEEGATLVRIGSALLPE